MAPVTMTTLDVLKGARELLSDPEKWTQGWYARDAEGRPADDGNDPRAVCWCIWGACEKVAGDWSKTHGATQALDSCAGGHAPTLNDAAGTTHTEILGVLDCAIAKAGA